jgi:hypothetical protein
VGVFVSDEERAGELRHNQALASDAQEELARRIQQLGSQPWRAAPPAKIRPTSLESSRPMQVRTSNCWRSRSEPGASWMGWS